MFLCNMHIIDTNATGGFAKKPTRTRRIIIYVPVLRGKMKKKLGTNKTFFFEVFPSLKHSLYPNLCLLQNCTEFLAWFFKQKSRDPSKYVCYIKQYKQKHKHKRKQKQSKVVHKRLLKLMVHRLKRYTHIFGVL